MCKIKAKRLLLRHLFFKTLVVTQNSGYLVLSAHRTRFYIIPLFPSSISLTFRIFDFSSKDHLSIVQLTFS